MYACGVGNLNSGRIMECMIQWVMRYKGITYPQYVISLPISSIQLTCERSLPAIELLNLSTIVHISLFPIGVLRRSKTKSILILSMVDLELAKVVTTHTPFAYHT